MSQQNLNRFLILGLAVELIIFLFSFFESGQYYNETVRLSARYSGRLSLVFITLMFLIVSVNWKERRSEYKDRFLGLAIIFSFIHFIHFLFVVLNVVRNDIRLIPYKLIGGAFTYIFLITYPWFLNYKSPPKWMDYFYFYLIILLMILTIVSRINGVFEGSEPSIYHYFGLTIISLSIIFHISKVLKKS